MFSNQSIWLGWVIGFIPLYGLFVFLLSQRGRKVPQVDRQGQPYYIRRNAAHQAWSRVAGACIVGLTLAVNLDRRV